MRRTIRIQKKSILLLFYLSFNLPIFGQTTADLSRMFDQAANLAQTDPDSSNILFAILYQKALALDSTEKAGMAQYNIGINFFDMGNFDSSIVYLKSAEEIFLDNNYYRGLTLANVSMGNIQNFQGKIQDAIQFYHTALDFANLDQDTFSQARILNNLGAGYNSAGRIQQSLITLQQGLELAKSINNPIILGDIHNNISTNYEALNEFNQAIVYGEKAAQYFREGGDKEYEALALTNLAAYFLSLDSVMFDSVAYYLHAGKIILDSIHSPSILTNYYKQLTNLYTQQGRYDQAKLTADTCLDLLDRFPNLHGQAQVYDRLYFIYKAEGNTAKALEYFEKYFALKDTMVYDESNHQLQELEARYQSATKDALLANQELEITRRTGQRNLYLGFALALLAVGLFLYNRTRLKQNELELQKEQIANLRQQQQIVALDHLLQGQEEERTRIAQDLHDGLGGLLSTVQVQINHVLKNNTEDAALSTSAKLVSEACQEVRRIAHDMMPGSLLKIGLFAALADLIDTYAGSTDITFHYNSPEEEFIIADRKAISIYRSIQEIMNNLIKYAQAKNFYLNIEMNDGSLHILAEDDGVGFDSNKSDFGVGLGLEGIKSRIENLGGTCQISSKPGEGVRYDLIVPDIEYG